MDNMKLFELLGLSRDALNKKVPSKSDAGALKSSEEAVSLRKDLDELESLKEKCMANIEKIFQILNEDNVIPQFIKVLQKKTTEKAVNYIIYIRFLRKVNRSTKTYLRNLKN